jgi:hypothetical protein
MWGALSDERTGLLQCTSLTVQSRRTHNHILQSHLRLGSLFVAPYHSQGYGRGILTRPYTVRIPVTEVSSVRYELGFYFPEDIHHRHRREILKSYTALTDWYP